MDPMKGVEPVGASLRGMQVLLAATLGLALVGFAVGLRQGATIYTPPEPAPVGLQAISEEGVVPAVSYAEFDRRVHGQNRDWKNHIRQLEQPEVDLFAEVTLDEEARKVLQERRAERRAYPGAPPVSPHPLDSLSTASCIVCHGSGLTIGPVRAPAMSHGMFANCTQCHVEQAARHQDITAFAGNSFRPVKAPAAGERAWDSAPPTIPHPTWMRENCNACHGPSGPEPLRSSHPWRTSCLQCHAPSAELDQTPYDPRAPFLPVDPGLVR